MDPKFTRRTALAIGGASLATAIRPRMARAAERSDVIIIGAGFSGLNAAMILAENGAKVTVLEASDRIGGRAFTGDHIEGRPELGANQVAPFYARIRDIADRLGIRLIAGSNKNAPFSFSIGGQLVSAEDWESSPLNKTVGPERAVQPSALKSHYMIKFNPLRELDTWIEKEGLQYDISYGAWLRSVGASPEAIRLIGENSIGEDIWRVSALRYIQDATRARAFFEGGEAAATGSGYEIAAPLSYRVEGGISRLPEAMAAILGDNVHTNKIVARINMDKSGVDVVCIDGTRYAAKHIISAIPFPALRSIEVNPGFVGGQFKAVNHMPYRNNSQVYLSLSGEPFWEQDDFAPSVWTDDTLDMIRVPVSPDGQLENRLSVVVVGKSADRMDQYSQQDRADFVIREIERIRPSTKGKLTVTGMHSWRKASFNLGCSHSFDAGTVTEFGQSMINPHHRMHFAGEHTRRLEVGMESAMESGERVAFEILEAIG